MQHVRLGLLGAIYLLTACLSKPARTEVDEVRTSQERQGLFSMYLNSRLNLDEATIEGLKLGGVELGSSCAREYAPLLQMGLDGYIEALQDRSLAPIDLSCISTATRRLIEICDFGGLPTIDQDCRNQLALVRVRLVAQLEADAALSSLRPDLLAHRIVDRMLLLGKNDSSEVLTLVDQFLRLKPEDVDAHSIRVLLLLVSNQIQTQLDAYQSSIHRLQDSQKSRARSFANLMQFNVAHLAYLQEHTAENLQQLTAAAQRLAQLSPHPLAGREAEAAAALYSGDRQRALAIMRDAVSLPQADDITKQGLSNLEAGIDRPFKIRMFYLLQF